MDRNLIRIPSTVAGRKVTIHTHPNPHPDELLCIYIVENWGTFEFLRRYAPDGILEFGVGKGRFNDHLLKSGETSSAMLLANGLGVEHTPQIAGLLSYVHKNDTGGGDQPFNLCRVLTLMGQHNVPVNDLIRWAFDAFDMKVGELKPSNDYSLQYIAMLLAAAKRPYENWLIFGMKAKVFDHFDFVETAKADFEAHSTVEHIKSSKGDISLCSVRSDCMAIMRYARSQHGANAAVVVKIDSRGNVAIQTDQRLGLDLGDLVAMIKFEEQKLRGKIHCSDPDVLRADGTIDEEWDVWHYAHGTNILNGSHSHNEIDPTRIPFERILEIVKIALDPNGFEPECSALCLMGMCPASTGTPCRLFPFGFARCRAIRDTQE